MKEQKAISVSVVNGEILKEALDTWLKTGWHVVSVTAGHVSVALESPRFSTDMVRYGPFLVILEKD